MTVKNGDKVSVEYEGKFDSGEVFDSSKKGEENHPLEFEVGSGQVIKGFDEAIAGMNEGEEKEFSIEPVNAYGERKEELKKDIPKSALPPEQEPKVGMVLMLNAQGQQVPATIAEVDEEKVVIDLNHPLAGKRLNFKIKVMGINSK